MAARSSLYAIGYEEEEFQDDGFIRALGWYGTLSLRIARELSSQTTDVMTWLAHENLQFITLFEGDASLGVWRQVGDFATDLLALGLNLEATYQASPFFLAECRRRTFARAYFLDKVFAAVFNRPPRITARHADCNLPLDLSDDALFQSPDGIEQAKTKLDQGGWNTDGKHRAATWARIRYILAEFREEIVEYQFRSMNPADTIKLRQDCWTSNLSPALCHMHAKVYLAYLHIHFQSYRLLGTGDGSMAAQPELLETSANMLETIVQMGNCRGRTLFTPRDLPGIILSYGLPSAVILLNTLEIVIEDPSKPTAILPSGITTSNLIRNLSVLVSQLENFSSPRETNQLFCLKASKVISRKLNNILENFPISDSAMPTKRTPEPDTANLTTDEIFTSIPDIDTINIEDFDPFDIADWAINFDLGAMSDDWAIF
ncbi:hypothetical protein N7508_004299 [Penicillium antarcticum]|uniref:uncharacterized protein n=1 Tax=Penicillium antarcticum TaxID=416450 RepID=UPI00238CDAD0|nr:uncharacterized protein N7508_004299 [Penicillium antarcticum]KAJ5308920.1 hypothetical protein N7508_004299 [Penicillium antarcticum]